MQPSNEPEQQPGDQVVGFEPTQEHVHKFARQIGMDPEEDSNFLYIAQQALNNPPPEPWQEGLSKDGAIVYLNKQTNEETTDHPQQEYFQAMFQREKTV
jgi:hypothetical protein